MFPAITALITLIQSIMEQSNLFEIVGLLRSYSWNWRATPVNSEAVANILLKIINCVKKFL